MDLVSITHASDIPQEIIDYKIEHYKEVFFDHWERVFNSAPLLSSEETQIVLHHNGIIMGGCVYKNQGSETIFSDFSILPSSRGKGCARYLMNYLYESTKESDALCSLAYMDFPNGPNTPLFEFGKFMRKVGFTPHPLGKISQKEQVALDVYSILYPQHMHRLRVFKKEL